MTNPAIKNDIINFRMYPYKMRIERKMRNLREELKEGIFQNVSL